MNVVIFSVRTGWHTDQLCRALAERGHEGRVLPYEGLVARFGGGGGAGTPGFFLQPIPMTAATASAQQRILDLTRMPSAPPACVERQSSPGRSSAARARR